MSLRSKSLANPLLDQMQYTADPLADRFMASLLRSGAQELLVRTGQRQPAEDSVDAEWKNHAVLGRIFGAWTNNRSLVEWQPHGLGLSDESACLLEAFVQTASGLPAWADERKMLRAECLFTDFGALSGTLLPCSSLAECYVIPDIAVLLHITRQLQEHTDYRIRSTGAMMLPIFLPGGLTDPDGYGAAQVLKVRLVHASVRTLVLRGDPEKVAMSALSGVVPPLRTAQDGDSIQARLFANGWDIGNDGLPCNQEELGYVLLTFSYIFLRSMRKLGLQLSPDDEEAYLHIWNVVGHAMGINRALLVDTMRDAAALFSKMQVRGRAEWAYKGRDKDPRPFLGHALVNSMQKAMSSDRLKAFPALMTYYLCGRDTARDLGVLKRTHPFWRVMFICLAGAIKVLDRLLWLMRPGVSISRFVTRTLGYRFAAALFADGSRPLNLPEHIRVAVNHTIAGWRTDARAPAWLNALGKRLTPLTEATLQSRSGV